MNNVGGIFRALWQVITDPLRRERGYDTKTPTNKPREPMTAINADHFLDYAEGRPIPGGALMNVRRFCVIHFTDGATAESSISWWRNPAAKGANAHVVIDRDGTVYQCRPFNRTCGHAGRSKWRDPNTGKLYSGLNSCSIGIELANGGCDEPGPDGFDWAKKQPGFRTIAARHKNGGTIKEWEAYPQAQIDACFRVVRNLVERYNLDDVIGHDDIAPDRKIDPGPAFPMGDLREHCGMPREIPSL